MIRLVIIAAVAIALADGGQAQTVKKMPVAAQSQAAVPEPQTVRSWINIAYPVTTRN